MISQTVCVCGEGDFSQYGNATVTCKRLPRNLGDTPLNCICKRNTKFNKSTLERLVDTYIKSTIQCIQNSKTVFARIPVLLTIEN